MNIFFIIIFAIVPAAIASRKAVVEAKHTQDHHKMKRLLQEVMTFENREDFQNAVDLQFAGTTPDQFFENFDSFLNSDPIATSFRNTEVAVPIESSGLPTLFTVEQTADLAGIIVGEEGFEQNAMFFFRKRQPPPIVRFLDSGFFRFPQPGVIGFFADFSTFFQDSDFSQQVPQLGLFLIVGMILTIPGTGEIIIRLPFRTSNIRDAFSFGFLLPNDSLGVEEIDIQCAVCQTNFGFSLILEVDNVAGVQALPLCCTYGFDRCAMESFCNESQDNCLGPCNPNGDAFWYPLDESTIDPTTCEVRLSSCMSNNDCCGPLICAQIENPDGNFYMGCEVDPNDPNLGS